MGAAELRRRAREAVDALSGELAEPCAESAVTAALLRTLACRIAASRGVPLGESDLDAAGLFRAAAPVESAPVRRSLPEEDLGRVDIEELGYVYESLLERSSRRDTGTHYTPRVLADDVVAHTLAPLVAAQGADVRVADIAAGTGVFLVAAARYLADATGTPLREVVPRCVYGADIDPLAVDLAKVSLWLLVGDPDLPLTFLDDKILCGNSLVGLVDVSDWPDAVPGPDPRRADAVVAVSLRLGGRGGPRLDEALARLATLPPSKLPRPATPPIHWALVAPEVMARGGFDAVVGNPPYLGVKRVRDAIGRDLRDYLARTVAAGETRRADYVIYFLLRAARLCRGEIGLITTDSVAEGDTARYGLGALLEGGWRIARAERSAPWPTAAVRFAKVWLSRSPGERACLDGREVAVITSTLEAGSAVPEPLRLDRFERPLPLPHGYQGTIVLGRSLVLTPELAEGLGEGPLGDAVRPYLSGEDLVAAPGAAASRCVLDVGRYGLEELAEDEAIARHLRRVVRPERAGHFAKYPQLKLRWWGFLSPVDELYREAAGLERVVAFSKHSKHLFPVLVGAGHVFSNGLVVYPTQDPAAYAFLASELHRLWAVRAGGSMLNNAHRYNPSRLRATYPFPADLAPLGAAGERLLEALDAMAGERRLGMTAILNLVHDPAVHAADVVAVREALSQVNADVVRLQGLDERYAATELGETGFRLPASLQHELMAALVEQNHALAAAYEERRAGAS